MIIKPTTFTERKEGFLKTLLNNTDKVSKISEHSVLSGIANGISKISLLAEKDIAIHMSQLLPDDAYGEVLDVCAQNFGVPSRKGSSKSSTYVRITANPGTTYIKSIHLLRSNSGILFELDQDITIGSQGFNYVKIKSLQEGIVCNVDTLSISSFTTFPTGHRAVINEVAATGATDIESDDSLRKRIKGISNILQTGTMPTIEQVCIRENHNIFKIYYAGLSETGNIKFNIATENGANLTEIELSNLKTKIYPYLSLVDKRSGIQLNNIEYHPIDISFRIEIDPSYQIDEIRKQIQYGILSYLDFRYYENTIKVEWDRLLEIVKSTKGVKYVPDQFFSPRVDVSISINELPRLRGFLMLDLNGTVMSNFQGTLSPVFYPNQSDFNLQRII